MVTGFKEYEKFMEKQRKKDLTNAIKFIGKILKGNPEYENDYEHIEFNFISETINKTYGDDNSVCDITLEELQAINKQVEELGWN